MSLASKEVLRGTISNYILLLSRIICSIFMARILVVGLGETLYGFWGFLWAVFGYSVLLDFGFGQTIQKFTAESDVKNDMKSFNSLVSTVMLVLCAFSVVIAASSLCIAYFLDHLVAAQPGEGALDMNYLKISFAAFGVGVSIVFPTGIFPEILAGIRRFDIKNAILVVNVLANLAGFYLLIKFGYSLLSIALFTAGLNLATNIVMIVIISRLLPGFRISPFLANFAKLREISSFSAYSYVCTISDMFITRTDRLIIGYFLGMSSLGVYQIGTRLPEMMEKLTTQFQTTLGPIAASLYKSGDFEKLRWVLLRSTKISAFVAGYFLVVFYLLSPQILKIWLKIEDPEAVKVTSICIASVFISVLFRSVQSRFMLMAGEHKHIAQIQTAYAILTLVLMITSVKFFGLLGLLYGALAANVIISVFIEFPLAARLGKMSVGYYLRKVYFPLLIPIALCAGAVFAFLQIPGPWNLLRLGIASVSAGIVYLASGWFIFFSRDEKLKLLDMSKLAPVVRKLKIGGYLGLGV